MEELVYCHNRKCERNDCIRKETYMPFGVCCKRTDFECSRSNGYKYFLGENSNISESKQVSSIKDEEESHISKTKEFSYIDYLNQETGSNEIWFYVEPFVGNSDSINEITGKCAKYGTDLDKEKIDVICEKYPDKVKNFQVRDYKTWDKVLLNDKYAGHCIVYCEPPYINKPEEGFQMKEFVSVIEKWAQHNKVFVRMPQKAKSWEFICKVSDASSMFLVKK